MNISELQLSIRKYALANAVKFNGKANQGSVIAKIISETSFSYSSLLYCLLKIQYDLLRNPTQPKILLQSKQLYEYDMSKPPQIRVENLVLCPDTLVHS